MKIAHVVSTYPPYRGGMGRVAFEYTERLRARGHDVHVYTPRYKAVADDPPYVHRVPSPLHIGNAGVVPSLFRRLSGFDIVHLHYPFFGGAEPVIVGKAIRPDQRLVITYHMDAVANGWRGAVFQAHRRVLFPWLMSRANAVLSSSKDYADTSALAELPNIMKRLEIHPFGVDLERFQPGSEPDLRTRLGIPTDMPVMVFVGGLDSAHHFKGMPVLLEALARIPHTPWFAVIVGDGDLRASFEAQAESLGIRDRLRFAGNVDDGALPRYYRLAQFHVFPSTERAEAFGMVALEAAASGIPCIASDLPGVRTVVINGETGLLVPPGNVDELAKSITLLLEQPDLRERLGHSARKRTEADFAWDPLISKLEETYKRL